MGILEDVKRMQSEGKTPDNISQTLLAQGIPQDQIRTALSQSQITSAVSESQDSMNSQTNTPTIQESNTEGMQPSMLSQPQLEPPPQNYQDQYSDQEYDQYGYDQYPQDRYPEYQSPALSSDTITEISEQVVEEKLSYLNDHLKQVIDLKNTLDTKISLMDSRLNRIEEILDRLQLSILQKVGTFMESHDDLKKEIKETQKSFKALGHKPHKKKNKSKKKLP